MPTNAIASFHKMIVLNNSNELKQSNSFHSND